MNNEYKYTEEYFDQWYRPLKNELDQIQDAVGKRPLPIDLSLLRFDELLLIADDPKEPLHSLARKFVEDELKPNNDKGEFVFTFGQPGLYTTVIYDFKNESQSNNFKTLAGALLNATNELPLDDIQEQEETFLKTGREELSLPRMKNLLKHMTKEAAKVSAKDKKASDNNLQDLIKSKDYKGISAILKNGISEYLNTDQYKNYLEFFSKFYKYSSRNNRLILSQNAAASNVASFKKWKELGRTVTKGSKAIYVYAPMQVTKKDSNNKPVVDENSEIQKETFFKLVPVFDISQTTGKDLPKQVSELTGELESREKFTELYKALTETTSAKVELRKELTARKSAEGYFSPTENLIAIKMAMGEEQTIKTLINEVTHAELHANSQAKFESDEYSVQEFEAESVAYIVADHLGIDTSQYSFGYLASWTDNGEKLEEFQTSLETITKEAKNLITKIDATLEKSMALSKPENKFEERVSEARKEIKEVAAAVGSKQVEVAPKSPSL